MRSLAAALSGMPTGTRSLASGIAAYLSKRAHRRALTSLEELDDRLLRDIGLTRGDLAVMRREF